MTECEPETAAMELPRDEPVDVPATVYRVEPRLLGASPRMLGALGAAALLIGIALFALGHWPVGSLFCGLAALLGGLCVSLAVRDARSPLGHRVLASREGFRAWARLAGVSVTAWSSAGREVLRLRRERWALQLLLRRRLLELGEAVDLDDAERAARLKVETQTVRRELQEREHRLVAALARARGRVVGERLTAQRTQILR
jgi:hypothetical protein